MSEKNDDLVVAQYDGTAGAEVSNAYGTWTTGEMKDVKREDLVPLGDMFKEIPRKGPAAAASAKKK